MAKLADLAGLPVNRLRHGPGPHALTRSTHPPDPPLMADRLVVRGAREHNLGISLDLPRDKLDRLTGLSGSGKSPGLRHDLCEGQRRYVESLSA